MKQTIASWSNRPHVKSITYPLFQKYADYYGYDFNYDWNPIPRHGTGWLYWAYQKFGIYDLLDRYDQVCWIDDDVFISDGAKNIFEYVSFDKLGFVLHPGDHTEAAKQVQQQQLFDEWWVRDEVQNNSDFHDFKEYGCKSPIMNSGVMVVSKKHQFIFDYKNLSPPYEQYEDQAYINGMINKNKVDYVSLGHECNLNYGYFHSNQARAQAYFLHLCGMGWSNPKNQIPHDQLSSITIETDQLLLPENWHPDGSPLCSILDDDPDIYRARIFLWFMKNNIIIPFNRRKM
jgi:hypothetical protein